MRNKPLPGMMKDSPMKQNSKKNFEKFQKQKEKAKKFVYWNEAKNCRWKVNWF